jgi:NAD(P)-dependent dehydrogenase (short-subunit alcohol dehydrogenase family)
MGEFDGKVVIVSGAAGGISRVVLTRFLEAGAAGTIADVDDEWGQETEQRLRAAEHNVRFIHTDVRSEEQVDRMIEETVATFGRVDILIHGAGLGFHKEVVDLSIDEWNLVIDVQLRGAFLLSRGVARQLIRQGESGRIILLGSGSGNNARPRSAAHGASKAGEIQFAKVLALELGKYNITCNVVSPGLTDISGISRSSQTREYQEAHNQMVPLGRLATPDEVADAVLFFASDKARFITGQMVNIDGGYSAGKLSVSGPLEEIDYGLLGERT